ncbi:MAG TPA: hydroxyacid dehydrogenase [Anaerolineae bacterium]|nr:hydroxyacid dehydrogenase [Anaerolineae bacterium]
MRKIVIPDDFPPMITGSRYLEYIKPYGEVIVYNTKAEHNEELIKRCEGAWALINVRAFTKFTGELLDHLPDLKIISILGTGTDHVDLKSATEHEIVVTNTPVASTISVAEHTFALILACALHLAAGDRKLRQGEWYHREGYELGGKTLGLIGLGFIAQHVAKLGQGFGMKVVGWSRTRDEERALRCNIHLVEIDELLALSDVVSLHLRLTEETEHIIGEREFSLMHPHTILVNTARGKLIDERALINALRERKIAAAGLDVFEQEPLTPDHSLLAFDNVVLTPHVGWITYEATDRLIKMPVDNIINFYSGNPTNVVNPEVLT